jgi:glycosyltransferase involved in cell wall biosynthesis
MEPAMEPRFAFLSTYPPRRCGIATFTRDLAGSVGNREIVAIHWPGDRILYPLEVTGLLQGDNRADYSRAADQVSASGVSVVSIQHEYGLFGGRDGDFILDFLDRIRVPAVATLHTVLRQPSASQRHVMTRLLERTAAAVVMSQAAARLLRREYGADSSRTRVIPHGVPNLPLVDSDLRKPDFGLEGRSVILSFGLLGPGKGYEHVIEAMSRVRRERPDALYVVLGATHPNLIRSEGEAYRDRLRKAVNDLGLRGHVLFVDRFVGQEELGRWLQAADVFVTPYPNLDQIVSGTLSYALAAGRPVVSTPFAYASEVLSGGRGVIVEPNSPEALADGSSSLLGDRARRGKIGRAAYAFSRGRIWPEVGAAYRALLTQVAAGAQLAGNSQVARGAEISYEVPALVAHG